MAYLILFLSLALGASIVSLVPLKFYKAEFVAWSLSVGIFLASWIFCLFALILPYNISLYLSIALMTIVISGCWVFRKPYQFLLLTNQKSNLIWLLGTGLFSILLSYLFYTHMLQVYPDGWHSNGGSWGDMAVHLTYVNFFASQSQLQLDMPLLVNTKLTYPFLIDFYSSILYRTGLSTQFSFLIPGLALALSFVQLLFFVSYRFFGKAAAAVLTIALFLLNGSFSSLYYWFQSWQSSGKNVWEYLSYLPKDFTNSEEFNLHFTNFITTHLLPQRSILFGFTLFCIVLTCIFEAYKNKQQSWVLLGFAGLITGLLPFAHAHTFLVLLLVFGWISMVKSLELKTWKNPWLLSLGLCLLIALPQLWWMRQGASSGRLHLGWMRKDDEQFLYFWLRNLGIGFLLLLLVPTLLKKYKVSSFFLHIYLVMLVIFVAINLYIFQPYDYDNLKLIAYCYLIFSIFAGYIFWAWLKQGLLLKIMAMIIVVSLALPGSLAILKETQDSYVLISKTDLEFAEAAKNIIPAGALVLTADQHNHPITAVTGRKTVVGFHGWLWSYGIDFSTQERDVRAMFAGGFEADRLLHQYGVAYVVIGPQERSNFGANYSYFISKYKVVYSSGEWTIVQLVNPSA